MSIFPTNVTTGRAHRWILAVSMSNAVNMVHAVYPSGISQLDFIVACFGEIQVMINFTKELSRPKCPFSLLMLPLKEDIGLFFQYPWYTLTQIPLHPKEQMGSVDDAPPGTAFTSARRPCLHFRCAFCFTRQRARAHVELLGPCFKTGRTRMEYWPIVGTCTCHSYSKLYNMCHLASLFKLLPPPTPPRAPFTYPLIYAGQILMNSMKKIVKNWQNHSVSTCQVSCTKANK